MRTIDVNEEHQLALVQDGAHWASGDNNTRYIPLADAPPLDDTVIAHTYMHQLHYVAAHITQGLVVNERRNEAGEKPPRRGWTRWHP